MRCVPGDSSQHLDPEQPGRYARNARALRDPEFQARRLWLGPFLRYFQIVQEERTDFNNSDAKIVIAGLSFEAGSEHRPPTKVEPIGCPDCPTVCVPTDASMSARSMMCRHDGVTPVS